MRPPSRNRQGGADQRGAADRQLRLELGYGLLGLINSEKGQRLTDQIKSLRRQLAVEMASSCRRCASGQSAAARQHLCPARQGDRGRARRPAPQHAARHGPRGETITLPGEHTTEPTFGLPALWMSEGSREEATFRGYTVVEPQTVVTTHLTETIKDNMAELLSYAETQKLLDELDKSHQKLIADMIPTQIAIGGVQRVLQNLLAERVSIASDHPRRHLRGLGYSRNVSTITEHVRTRLARQISETHTSESGYIPLVTLSPQWEQSSPRRSSARATTSSSACRRAAAGFISGVRRFSNAWR